MGLVAVIAREPALLMTEWLQCIRNTSELVSPQSSVVFNAFTRERQIHTPRPSVVEIAIGEERVGAIEPSSEFDEDGELHVYAPNSEMTGVGKRFVEAMATSIMANVVWLP